MTWYLGGKWRLESLIDRYIFPSCILTIGGQVLQHWPWYVSSPLILSPLPLALCTSVTLSFLQCFGKALLSLITGAVIASDWNGLHPLPLFPHCSAQESCPHQGRVSQLLSKSSPLLCVFHDSTAFLLSIALSISCCSCTVVWPGLIFPWGWKCPESRNCVRFCAPFSLRCLHLIKFVAPMKRATKLS